MNYYTNNKKIAIVFPGQGSQKIGVGKDIFEHFSIARQTYEEAEEALGKKLINIIFGNNEKELTLTYNAQPLIMLNSIAIIRVIEKAIGDISSICSVVAGHSVGEYTALCAAKSINLKYTAQLLYARGKEMDVSYPAYKGGMAAVIGCDYRQMKSIIAKANKQNIICISNDNTPEQIVISGPNADLEEMINLCKEDYKKRVIKLNVSGPFHSIYMEKAKIKVKNLLDSIDILSPSPSFFASNTLRIEHDSRAIKAAITNQISSTVRWRETCEALDSEGYSGFIEVGGNVLSRLIKANIPAAKVLSIVNKSDVINFLNNFPNIFQDVI